MPRMFDILRNNSRHENPQKKKEEDSANNVLAHNPQDEDRKDEPLSFPKKILQADINREKDIQDHSLISKKLIAAVKQHGIDSQEKADEIYENAVRVVKELLEKINSAEDLNPFMDKLQELMDNVFNQVIMGDNILNNIYQKGKDEYFLPYHIVNVLILSYVIGLDIGFNKSRLSYLGLASIFYDSGMHDLYPIISQPRILSEEERNTVKQHIAKSTEIVNRINTVNDVVKETISAHHERVNGKGYPLGIVSDGITPYAKILGLIDTYESLTHNRPHRPAVTTHEAVKLMVTELKNEFDAELMKVFINNMSVYPIGSLVRLDTDEVARVVSVQEGFPLRPIIMILSDANGEPVKERVIIDLSKQDFPSIKECMPL
ncbi:MAG: hypothetical protein NC923_07365 [Candidatus Omnitrophica bacterium]|nr:hypothetical protein [Candidatus Omnitrophota bacterium]